MPKKSKSSANVPKAVKKYVKSKILQNMELKRSITEVNYSEGTASTSSAGTVNQAFLVAQGDNNDNRVGNVTLVKGVSLRYVATPFTDTDGNTSSPPVSATQFRVVLLVDHQGTGTAPTIAEIFDSTGTDAPKSQININAKNSKRFTILHDKMHYMSPLYSRAGISVAGSQYSNAVNNSDGSYINVKRIWKNKNIKVQWDGTANTDYNKNMLWLVLISNQATARAPFINADIDFDYTDA